MSTSNGDRVLRGTHRSGTMGVFCVWTLGLRFEACVPAGSRQQEVTKYPEYKCVCGSPIKRKLRRNVQFGDSTRNPTCIITSAILTSVIPKICLSRLQSGVKQHGICERKRPREANRRWFQCLMVLLCVFNTVLTSAPVLFASSTESGCGKRWEIRIIMPH